MNQDPRHQDIITELTKNLKSTHFKPNQQLLDQIKHLNYSVLADQKALIACDEATPKEILPFEDYEYSGSSINRKAGEESIRQGALGCMILAGGQGTRLGFNGPKGCFPISSVHQKSLFQLICEKTLSAQKKYQTSLHLAFMTSPENDLATRSFFQEHHYFGLNADQIAFFCQSTLPFLNIQGELFLESEERLAEGPNGNGYCLHHFVESGLWKVWKNRGIKNIHLILVDNPLADPFDEELLGFHLRHHDEMTIKSVEKYNPTEKVGLIVKKLGRCAVVEYSEFSSKEQETRASDGKLKHRCANISTFCFSMSFVQRIAQDHPTMPLHKAWKKVRYLNQEGISAMSAEPRAWKFETFIFDVMSFTDQIGVLLYPREACFAPLKNAEGSDSAETVKQSIQMRERALFKQATGRDMSEEVFELPTDYYYSRSFQNPSKD